MSIRIEFFECLMLASLLLINAGCAPSEQPPIKVPESQTKPVQRLTESPANAISSDTTAIQFQEHPSAVEFEYRNGREAGLFAILESLGGGVGAIDYDNDGDIDLFLPGGGGFLPDGQVTGRAAGLFRQQAPWQFIPVASPARVDSDRQYSHGVAVADTDNDGFKDILVTGYGGPLLYRNRGDGTFTESASASGLNDTVWSSSAAWGDLNEDGMPDLYIAHYVDWSPTNSPQCFGGQPGQRDVCPPKSFQPLDDVVYFNEGDGSFRDVTSEAGFIVKDGGGKGLGVLIADVDLDSHLDVYVANDTVPNFLFHNEGHGRFTNFSAMSGTAVNDRGTPDGSMGVDIGDFDLDGLPDLWVSNYERESFALYRNIGHSFFRHISQTAGVTAVGAQYVGWGTVFFDVDNDGDEDVFVSNGHVIYHSEGAPFRQRPLLFENLQGRRFENIAPLAGPWMASEHPGRGCTSADLDGDGDLDLIVSQLNEPVSILENRTSKPNHWLVIDLIGTTDSRDSSGARVVVTTSLGRQMRQAKGGSSYGSTSDSRLYLGLGTADRVASIEVQWLSGTVQSLTDIAADQELTIIQPKTAVAH